MPCRANSLRLAKAREDSLRLAKARLGSLRLAKTRQGSPELAYSGQQSAGVALLRSRLHQSCPTLVNASPELPRSFHQSSELWRTTDTRKCVQIRVGVDTTGLVCAILPPVQSGIWAMNSLEPRRGVVRSCKVASESFDEFNRSAAALAKSQDRRASAGVFAFGTGRQGALVNEPAWAAPKKHRPSYTRKRCRLACQRGTREHAGASGETNPAWKESLPPRWPGVFGLFKYLGREESPRAFTLGGLMPKSRIDSKKDGGHNPENSTL